MFKAVLANILTTTAATVVSVVTVVAHAVPIKYASFEKKPKLVVVMVIDQFRADHLTRFSSRFLPATTKNGDVGGFKFLMTKAAYFPNAHFDVLQNMTCPGHATILTGSYPYQSGIPINDWYDRAKGKMRYCVEDDQDKLSPRNLQGSTVGDELKNAGYPGKVVALALKDRAAILLGGHRSDLTFWLGGDGKWMTSTYWGKLPEWLEEQNEELAKGLGKSQTWTQAKERTGFSEKRERDFAHTSKQGELHALEGPYGVKITADAAIAALKQMNLGKSKTTDLLAVSFSTHDLIGHQVGPNAPEMEEITVVEDAAIAQLINAVRKQVALKDVTFVLTADHGVAPEVEYLKATKTDAGFIDSNKVMAGAEKELTDAFGKPKTKWMAAQESFNFYFTSDALNTSHSRVELENRVKAYIAQQPGVAHVFSLNDYLNGNLPVGETARQINKSYIPGKSGDVVIIPKPFWMEAGKPATHMTGYSYDRSVPLLIAGPHIKAGVYGEQADIVDLAPTLSFLLGVIAPAQSEGRVLTEAIGD